MNLEHYGYKNTKHLIYLSGHPQVLCKFRLFGR